MTVATHKNLFRPLQLAIVIILCVVGALYWYAGRQQQRYDEAATHYLRSALTDISAWQREGLQRQFADEALRALDSKQMDAIDDLYRPLGRFAQLNDVKFSRLTAAMSLLGRHCLVSYHGSAQFQHGTADFTATLIVRDDDFRLYNLSFSSPQLR